MIQNREQEGKARLAQHAHHELLSIKCLRAARPGIDLEHFVMPSLPPGVIALVASDIPGSNSFTLFGNSFPILAHGITTSSNQPIALLAGPDPDALSSFASEIARQLLPANIDLAKVRASDSDTHAVPKPSAIVAEPNSTSTWRGAELPVLYDRIGDTGEAFENAHSFLEEKWYLGSLRLDSSEESGAIAVPVPAGIDIICATQWPAHVRAQVASVLGIEEAKVHLTSCRLGKHFNSKIWFPSLVSCFSALVAWKSGQRAGYFLSPLEEHLYAPKRACSTTTTRAALTSEGNVSALAIDVDLECGYPSAGLAELQKHIADTAVHFPISPNIEIAVRATQTEGSGNGLLGDLGSSHINFALQTMATRIAISRNIDPMDYHLLISKSGSGNINSAKYAAETKLVDALGRASDWKRKFASHELARKRREGQRDHLMRGIGCSFAWQAETSAFIDPLFSTYSVEVELTRDQTLLIKTSAVTADTYCLKDWKLIAGELLSLEETDIEIETGCAHLLPHAGPEIRSRSAHIVSNLIRKACNQIKNQRFRNPLPLKTALKHRVHPSQDFASHPAEISQSTIEKGRMPVHAATGPKTRGNRELCTVAGTVVELQLDRWTYLPRITGVWICIDGGNILSPVHARNALRSDCLASLASCFASHSASNMDSSYFPAMSTLSFLPEIEVVFLSAGRSEDQKAFDELPFLTIPGALISALSQACGIEFNSLPVSISDILFALAPNEN